MSAQDSAYSMEELQPRLAAEAAPVGDNQLGPLLLAAAEAEQVIEGMNLVRCVVKVFAAKHTNLATSL